MMITPEGANDGTEIQMTDHGFIWGACEVTLLASVNGHVCISVSGANEHVRVWVSKKGRSVGSCKYRN